MEHMLAKVLGCKRMDLYLMFDRPLSEGELAPLRDLLKKRGQRVPLQHLLGTVEFLGREFVCDARGLIARPETEDLVVEAVRRAKALPAPLRVLDIGAGSGVIGLSLAAELGDHLEVVVMVDASADALALTEENRQKLGLSDTQVVVGESDLLSGDVVSQFAPYDVILSNPPYIPSGEIPGLQAEVHADPVMALDGGADGLDLVRRILESALGVLKPHGFVGLELGAGQAGQVEQIAIDQGLAETAIIGDMTGIDRFVFASRLQA